MTARRRAALAALAVGLALRAVPAGAETRVAGASFPDTIVADGQTLHLNGVGVRVFFHLVNGYATALYLLAPAHSEAAILAAPGPKVIFTEFLHDAPVERIRAEYDAINRRFCATSPCTAADDASYRAFTAHLAPAKAGGTQTVLVTADGVTVSRDGAAVQRIADPAFGRDLVRSLVGPAAPTAGYREGIIGAGR